MHKFDDLLPGSLDFRDPYGESGIALFLCT